MGARVLHGLVLTLALAGLVPRAAGAADPAREQLVEGYRLKQVGRFKEALPHLNESFRLAPKLQTLINLADCEEQLGLLVEARDHWRLAAVQAARESDGRTQGGANARAAAVEARLPHLSLQLAAGLPADTTVYRNEVAVPLASLNTPLAVNPGEQRIVVRALGHADFARALMLVERDNQTLMVLVGPAGVPTPAPLPPSAPVVRRSHDAVPPARPEATAPTNPKAWSPGSTQRTWGIVAGSAGVVSLAISTLFWQKAASDIRSAEDARAKAKSDILVTNVTLVSGLVLLGGGVVLFAASPAAEQHAVGWRVAPTLSLSSQSAGVGATGRF